MVYKIQLVDCDGMAVVKRVWCGPSEPPSIASSKPKASRKKAKHTAPMSQPRVSPRATRKVTRRSSPSESSSVRSATPESFASFDSSSSVGPMTPSSSSRSSPEPSIYSPISSDYSYLRYTTALSNLPDLVPSGSAFSSCLSSPMSAITELDACPSYAPMAMDMDCEQGDISYHLSELEESLADPFTLIHGFSDERAITAAMERDQLRQAMGFY